MASTRSSQTPQSSPPPSSAKKSGGSAKKAGTKRAATESSSSPPAKRGRGRPKKVQKTIEESMEGVEETKNGAEESMEGVEETNQSVEETKDGVEEKDIEDDEEVAKQIEGDEELAKKIEGEEKKKSNESAKVKANDGDEKKADKKESKPEEKTSGHVNGSSEKEEKANTNDSASKTDPGSKTDTNGEKNAFDEVKADTDEVKKDVEKEQASKSADINKDNTSVVEDSARSDAIPSSILEKGIIYFFFRGRVGVEDPQGLEDIARSYIVLRPLSLGAKLGDGPLEDTGNARLLALPKKMLPKSKQDRFLMFVEQPKASIKDLREHFASNEYATKTVGTSQTPAATPFAEGIYAITSTGRDSHLAYHITVPEIGEIQQSLGLNQKGSYNLSAKNPNAPGPANATLDNPAQYPEEIQKKFRNLRWMPLIPELLDYQNTQFLIIGEGLGDMGAATQEVEKDKKDDSKDKPVEELEKLEEEDHERVDGLKEDDPVFADLGLSGKEYPKMGTTW